MHRIIALCALAVMTLTGIAQVSDSIMLSNARPVIFKVNKTYVSRADSLWLADTLRMQLDAIGNDSYIYGRAAASPEGPYQNNVRLANGRRNTAINVLSKVGYDTNRILFTTVPEDWDMLVALMDRLGDTRVSIIRRLMQKHGSNREALKLEMRMRYPQLWKTLLYLYFPELRSVRIIAVPRRDLPMREPRLLTYNPEDQHLAPLFPDSLAQPTGIPMPQRLPRREHLSIKTNLLLYGAYVPKYGFAPIPNIALEYYPRKGHFTAAGSFDCAWWVGNTDNHKYFEVRNYQIEGRYYLRNSSRSYDVNGTPNGLAAFKGLYFSAYTHAGLYQFGFNAQDGIIGEAFGGGIGIGYVLPLSRRNQHWRLEFAVQGGYFYTKYDPFVYGCPVEGIEDGLYYYDWNRDGSLFVPRQYVFQGFLPTRVGITLTYDLLYRRGYGKRGMSLRRYHHQKGGRP